MLIYSKLFMSFYPLSLTQVRLRYVNKNTAIISDYCMEWPCFYTRLFWNPARMDRVRTLTCVRNDSAHKTFEDCRLVAMNMNDHHYGSDVLDNSIV